MRRTTIRGAARRGAGAGFTILEILIAIVILVLGISGIIALFPTAIESGNQTVQDTYAASITQSVIDAVSVGMRECRFRTPPDGNGRVWTYFILDHDGVWDPMSPTPQDYSSMYQIAGNQFPVSDADWCILLPQGRDVNNDPTQEPTFNYPAVRQCDNLGGGPQYIDARSLQNIQAMASSPSLYDDWDNRFMRATYKDPGGKYPYIRRVYHLGRYRRYQEKAGFPSPTSAPGPIRDEFLGETQGPAGTGSNDPSMRAIIDPYPQYSFSLAIRRAKTDNRDTAGKPNPDGRITHEDLYSSSLYEVRVFIFRNFISDSGLHNTMSTNLAYPIPRSNVPIREFVTLMSL